MCSDLVMWPPRQNTDLKPRAQPRKTVITLTAESATSVYARGLNATFPESSRLKSTPAVYQQMSLAEAD